MSPPPATSGAPPEGPATGADVDRLGEAVDRLATTLRALDGPRLGRPPRRGGPRPGDAATQLPGASVADLTHALVLRLAAVQLELGDRPRPDRPVVPPRLADHAAGDQLAVVGRDAVRALRSRSAGQPAAGVAALTEELRDLRLRL